MAFKKKWTQWKGYIVDFKDKEFRLAYNVQPQDKEKFQDNIAFDSPKGQQMLSEFFITHDRNDYI